MPKIAVIINGNLNTCRTGQINSAICRIKNLKKKTTSDVDVYCIVEYDWGILRHLRKSSILFPKPDFISIDGINIRLLYKRNILIDRILESVLKLTPIYSLLYYKKIAQYLRHYDIISGHSIVGGLVAMIAHNVNGTPYAVTWHGTDIHTYPKTSRYLKRVIGRILKSASANIFVSNALLISCLDSYKECPNAYVLYNAPDTNFKKFPDEERLCIRKKWAVQDKKNVAFVGNLIDIKNVQILPSVFSKIRSKISDCSFWIIGDGYYKRALQNGMIDVQVDCKFFGKMPPEVMPELMNCIDVLILPSKNESFGMVLVEAIACGANAVGSNRGGIPEVIESENCFELDDKFADKISDRIVYMLQNEVHQRVNPDFDWTKTAEKEIHIYNDIIK